MCGIAAIYAYNYPALDVDRDELRTIRDHTTPVADWQAGHFGGRSRVLKRGLRPWARTVFNGLTPLWSTKAPREIGANG